MNDIRNQRLEADYRAMLRIQNRPYLSWIATKGEPPRAEEYLLTVRVRGYVLRSQAGRYQVGASDRFVIRVTLWDSYPHTAPYVRMLTIPPVFHPDWYSKGTYCSSAPWSEDTSLKDFVLRMIGTLQYAPGLMNADAPANYKALEWFEKRCGDPSLFPCDRTELNENTEEEIEAVTRACDPFAAVIDSWSGR